MSHGVNKPQTSLALQLQWSCDTLSLSQSCLYNPNGADCLVQPTNFPVQSEWRRVMFSLQQNLPVQPQTCATLTELCHIQPFTKLPVQPETSLSATPGMELCHAQPFAKPPMQPQPSLCNPKLPCATPMKMCHAQPFTHPPMQPQLSHSSPWNAPQCER